MIYDPVARQHRRVDQIEGAIPRRVLRTKRARSLSGVPSEPVKSSGRDDLYRIKLSNGRSFTATRNHRLADDGGSALRRRDRTDSLKHPLPSFWCPVRTFPLQGLGEMLGVRLVHHQIRRVIVRWIVVLVMHDLSRKQIPSKHLFRNEPMLRTYP